MSNSLSDCPNHFDDERVQSMFCRRNLLRKSILLTFFLSISSHAADACHLPPFTKPIFFVHSDAEPIKNSTLYAIPREHPLDADLCIVAASWIRPNQTDSIEIYVATYRKDNYDKIAEYRSTISDLQLWDPPQIAIVPTKFSIKPEVMAFGIKLDWQFLAGTYSQNNSQFELLVPTGGAKLRSVLSLSNLEYFGYRNCPEVCSNDGANCEIKCEGENTTKEQILALQPTKHQQYFDILVTTTTTSVDANNAKPAKELRSEQRYIWQSGKYIAE